MPEPILAWKKDGQGYFIELALGAKKDYSVDWSDFLADGDIIDPVVWTVPAGVEKSDEVLDGHVTQAKLKALAAGVHACSVKITTASVIETIPFRVIVA